MNFRQLWCDVDFSGRCLDTAHMDRKTAQCDAGIHHHACGLSANMGFELTNRDGTNHDRVLVHSFE